MGATRYNLLVLSKSNELFVDTPNGFAPGGACPVEQVAAALVAYGDFEVRVTFRTTEQHLAADLRTYSRRLARIAVAAGYTFAPFAAKSVNGHELTTTQETILRRA